MPSIPYKDKQQAIADYTDEIEKFSFEYQKLYIDRTWFEPQIFKARFWKRSSNFSNDLVSDGKLSGIIPSYIQEVIFIKNFSKEIRTGLISEGLEWLGSWAYDKIHKDEPQDNNYYLVAMVCKIVPVSHNPDSTLEW